MSYSRGPENTNSAENVYLELDTSQLASPPHVAVNSREHSAKTTYGARKQPCKKYSGNMRDAALSYARAGVQVFPLHHMDPEGNCSCGKAGCQHAGKHPRYHSEDLRNGHKDATTDPELIRRWFERWPEANIGIPTANRIVIDVDPRHGGDKSFRRLTETHGEMGRTRTHETGSGGVHFIYAAPEDKRIVSRRNALGDEYPGIDVKAEGGYIVAPPSRTTGAYAVLDLSPPASPPGWLPELLREQPGGSGGNGEKPAVSVEPDGDPIPEGTRDNTLTSIAGRLHNGSRTLEQLAADLEAVNRARCTPPLPECDTLRIARSIHRKEPCNPAPEPDPETLRAVRNLYYGVLARLGWKGQGGGTDRHVYIALLITAKRYGRLTRSGIKVSISVRELAHAAGTSQTTVRAALRRLARAQLVRRVSGGRGPKAGALLLKLPQDLHTQPSGGGFQDSVQTLSEYLRDLLRIRWGPGRIGKTKELYLELLLRLGSATPRELSPRAGNRRPDNIRRALRDLEARDLVECSDGRYSLAPDFAHALLEALRADGVPDVEYRQREEDKRQRLRYAEYRNSRGLSVPDGYISELERIPEDLKPVADPESIPEASSEPPKTPEYEARGCSEREFRELAAYGKRLPEPPKEVKVAAMCRRLRREDPECFYALRGSLRALGWELSARGWTSAVYSPATLERALELLEAERVPVAGAA